MAGFTQNIFGRGKIQSVAFRSISFKKYFKDFPTFNEFIMFFVPRFQRDPLKRYQVEIKYHLSNEFMTNNYKVLQDLIEDHKHLYDKKSIFESLETNSLSTSNSLPPLIHKIPSSEKLLNRPWLIKVQTNSEGKPPILKCYAIDEDGEIIEVDGKPSLIPPVLGPKAKQEVWKPKGWKPIRQTLKLHEIAPSPKCPKHQHLQKSKRYEFIRETLLQATIVTTSKEKRPELIKEFTQDHFNHRLKKLSHDITSPNWIPPKWSLPKEETTAKDDNRKENESSSSSESSTTSNSSSSTEKGIASSTSTDKQKLEEEQKKRLEDKKKKKEKKKKIQDEKRRLWKLALREAAGQAGFMGTYATRVGGLGRPF